MVCGIAYLQVVAALDTTLCQTECADHKTRYLAMCSIACVTASVHYVTLSAQQVVLRNGNQV